DLRFSRSHEWVRLTDNVATIGITDHAQRELTDIVFIELPEIGRSLAAGEACAIIESVKTASDVYSPLSGTVVEVNQAAVDKPALVNSDPYGQGWLIKLKLSRPAELSSLLSPTDYLALVQPETQGRE
ncbi:MAG: glycine cleavage system protein GcvH, partial [Candidatus Omnitrophica bacterium]|nr:glycine cleavage system protein GcvH [Candidatus Omnitrophota bacterium]